MFSGSVVLGLGSNLGSSIQRMRESLAHLKQLSYVQVLKISSVYESNAQLPEGADADWNQKYLNAAVLVRLTQEINPQKLLSDLKDIELKIGREKSLRWAPRVIDIDILFWKDKIIDLENLKVPHRHLNERPFALLPLLEVLPSAAESLGDLPLWSNPWSSTKPFNTQVSQQFFWPRFVGVLNITPDSFSDGGRLPTTESIVTQARVLIEAGAEVLDLGAESTRPMAASVDENTEYDRLVQALGAIQNFDLNFEISIDCRHPNVLRRVLEKFDFQYFNDVSGFSNKEMMSLLKETEKKAFVMHSITVPPSSDKILDQAGDPCDLLNSWWLEKINEFERYGIKSENVIFDPGIGFGKSKHQSLYILNHLEKFAEIKQQILIGHSRKSFQSLYSDRAAGERDLETSLVTQSLNQAYTQYLRLHDIRTQKIALNYKGVNTLTSTHTMNTGGLHGESGGV